jgi:hypothetical protein
LTSFRGLATGNPNTSDIENSTRTLVNEPPARHLGFIASFPWKSRFISSDASCDVLSSAHNNVGPTVLNRVVRLQMSRHDDLAALLDLDGECFRLEAGYWTKIEVRLVSPTSSVPHGIRYSLTLHDRSGRRILGFDNAHRVRSRVRSAARRIESDHRHDRAGVSSYAFESPGRLLNDFWAAVNEVITSREGENT